MEETDSKACPSTQETRFTVSRAICQQRSYAEVLRRFGQTYLAGLGRCLERGAAEDQRGTFISPAIISV